MSEWVDLQLSHQLAGVKAPDELWRRIEKRPRRRRAPRLAVATAAAVVVVIAVAYSAGRPRTVRAVEFPQGQCLQCHL